LTVCKINPKIVDCFVEFFSGGWEVAPVKSIWILVAVIQFVVGI